MKISAKIRAIYLIISTAFFVGLYVIISTFSKKYVVSARKWVSRKILTSNNLELEFNGTIDPKAQLFISNHQSMLDIMIIELLLEKKDVCFIAKKELFKIPFYGRAVKIPNMISIDRQNKKGMKRLVNEVEKRINKHRPVIIFPEGTRSKSDAFLSFKSGASFVANKLDLNVQPIVISNTKKIFSMTKLFLRPGKITVTVLESFNVSKANEGWLNSERDKMQEVYNRVS